MPYYEAGRKRRRGGGGGVRAHILLAKELLINNKLASFFCQSETPLHNHFSTQHLTLKVLNSELSSGYGLWGGTCLIKSTQ